MHLCTPPANYATIGVHKSITATAYCAHQPIILWAVCTKALRGYAVVHIARQLCDGQCAQRHTLPADRTMSGVHKGAQGIGCCAHRQKIVRRLVCTNLLQQWAIVHTTYSAIGWQCAQSHSSDKLLCTLLANRILTVLHIATRGMHLCAHHHRNVQHVS